MQFHEYVTLRNQWCRQTHDPQMREIAKGVNSDEFRKQTIGSVPAMLESGRLNGSLQEQFRRQLVIAVTEQSWVVLERPFYNYWPIAIELAASVKLNLPMSSVAMPFESLLLRFAKGHEPFGVGTAMMKWFSDRSAVEVGCWFANSADGFLIRLEGHKPEESVEDVLQKVNRSDFRADWLKQERLASFSQEAATALMVRLAIFVSLLTEGNDMITPVVLSKDRSRYDSTDDPDTKTWLEDRAARRAGRGFDVGQKLQEQKEKSPHWRNPHLALFWTGPGRTKPIIRMRSGAVVQRVSMADVPTGYLGPETDEEMEIGPDQTPREPFSKSRRFAIMKRDGYRCQLCGKSQEDGAKLHIDHRIALAKGGSNEDENLWTLCLECNLGKSDSDL